MNLRLKESELILTRGFAPTPNRSVYFSKPKVSKSVRGGFTLVEMLVAMGIFVIIIGIASGSFIKALRIQRNIVALIAANDNASLTIEQIAREMRTGYSFTKVSDNELSFTNANNEVVHYRLNSGTIQRGTGGGSSVSYKTITADNVIVNRFSINIGGSARSPRATISISVSAPGKETENISTNIQTTIVPRFIPPAT